MTKNDLVEFAKRRLNAGQPQPHVWPETEIDLAAAVRQATSMLADEIMADPARRMLLQQTYSVPLDGSGVGDPLIANGSVTGTAGEILMDGIKYGVVIDNDGNILRPLFHYSDFLAPQPIIYGYYVLKDRKILTRAINVAVNRPSDIVSASSPLSITANFDPTLVDSFPQELEPDVVNALCMIVTVKVTPTNGDRS